MRLFYFCAKLSLPIMMAFSFGYSVFPQSFTRIRDTSNPFVTDSLTKGYPGCSFIDYNNDGLQDIFINNDYLYKNEGNGKFSSVNVFKGETQPIIAGKIIGSGNSWADYNNDGNLDLFFSSAKSFLFQNNGNGNFTKITSGKIGDSTNNRGWACAWADYDNDGNIDLIITHPRGFIPGAFQPNHLFHNDGPPNYTFTEVTGFGFTDSLAPYTVATWYDYDQDGDQDLFIGSGPANGTPARDYLYKNMLKETGKADFVRINDSPIGTDLQDGQVWNWIDYDNDGDLDAFVTNYRAAPNRLYRNDNGKFTLINSGMELNGKGSLSNAWGDFDNDGYLDVIITSETKNYFFHNNGDGTFKEVSNGISITGPERGATIGDYDNDGDLDVFISGLPAANGLYRNDNSNGNHWKELRLIGTKSNKAAIGAMLKLKAVIGGKSMWQLREVSAQNSFNSQNSLVQHFGLGDASVIDSLIVIWPTGEKQVMTSLNVDNIETITETAATGVLDNKLNKIDYELEQNYPNPFNPSTTISYSIAKTSFVELKVFDMLGREMKTLVNKEQIAGEYKLQFDGAALRSGIYIYRIKAGEYMKSQKMEVLK